MRHVAALIAVPLCLLSIVLGVLGFVFGVLNGYDPLKLAGVAPGPLLAVTCSVVGAVVASRRPKNPMGWIFSIIGLSQGLVTFAFEYATYTYITHPGALPGGAAMAWLQMWAWMPGLALLMTFGLLLFPTGQLPSPPWRVVAWVCALDLALIVPTAVLAWPYRGPVLLQNAEQVAPGGLFGLVLASFFPLLLLCGLASLLGLIVRFRNARGIERQQLKWFTFAGIVFFAVIILSEAINASNGLGALLVLPFVPSVPIAAGLAILRYRLYDIDVLIRRTLIYSVLSALLALLYLGSVVILENLLRLVTGASQSQFVTVISTLGLAAVFFPLQARVQGGIDRRFYRRKYDAAKILAQFAATARDETDLEALSERLAAAVSGTLEPAHVTLWLRGVEGRTGERLVNGHRHRSGDAGAG